MKFIALSATIALVLIFALVNGLLMLFLPARHAALWQWLSRGGSVETRRMGAQIELRVAGLIVIAISAFISWILVGKIVNH